VSESGRKKFVEECLGLRRPNIKEKLGNQIKVLSKTNN
jgi:hypothetical protein